MAQTVLDNTSNRVVVLRLSLQLHNGSLRQNLKGTLIGGDTHRFQVFLSLIDHGLNHLLSVRSLREAVLTRVQPAFNRREITGHAVLLVVLYSFFQLTTVQLTLLSNNIQGLSHTLTLRHSKVDNIAGGANQRGHNSRAAHLFLQIVPARHQELTLAFRLVHFHKLISVSDNALLLKRFGNLLRGFALFNNERDSGAVSVTGEVTFFKRIQTGDKQRRQNNYRHQENDRCDPHDGGAAALTSLQLLNAHHFLLQGDAPNTGACLLVAWGQQIS